MCSSASPNNDVIKKNKKKEEEKREKEKGRGRRTKINKI